MHSIIVTRDAKLIPEAYADGHDRDTMHYVASVTKSITSVLIGILLDRGLVAPGALDTPTVDLFPVYADVIRADLAKADLRLRHIVSMSAGWRGTSRPTPTAICATTARKRRGVTTRPGLSYRNRSCAAGDAIPV